jgi:hypothetical protein
MGNPKHTPGPWRVEYDHICTDDLSVRICRTPEPGRRASISQQDANARLIAAAPELLEWLKESVEHAEKFIDADDPENTIPGFYWSAKAAIAKAEGRDK